MCDEAVGIKPLSLQCVLDRFKTKGMCERAVENEPVNLEFVHDHFKL